MIFHLHARWNCLTFILFCIIAFSESILQNNHNHNNNSKSDNWTFGLAFDWNCFMINVNSITEHSKFECIAITTIVRCVYAASMCTFVFQWNAPHEYHFYLWIWVSQVINFILASFDMRNTHSHTCIRDYYVCTRKTSRFTASKVVGFGIR